MTEQVDGEHVRFAGAVYLHLPLEATNPLDFTPLGDEENRWNRRGQPTLYLACDIGVVLAELGRHVDESHETSIARRIFRLEVDLDRLVDVRSADPSRYAERDAAKTESDERRASGSRGLIVPSVAFADRPDKFNIVVFLDNAGDSDGWIRSFVEVGGIVVGPLSPSATGEDVAR